MSFVCGKHGWRHLLNSCPSCSSSGTTVSQHSLSINHTAQRNYQDELAQNTFTHYSKMISCLKYYAQKHGKNSKAAVLLKELEIE